jgi:type II secretory pathway pseudopilin PulG
MLRRLGRGEEGFALPLTLFVIVIVAALSAVAIALATHSIERSSRDRLAARAQGAADAGMDAAAYRMSRALLAAKIGGALDPSVVDALLAEAGCLGLSAGGTQIPQIELIGNVTACTSTPEETIAEEVGEDGVGPPATFSYWVKNRVNVIIEGRSVVERQIIVLGRADDVTRRISGIYRFDLEAPATSVVQRVSYAECTAAAPPPGTDPATGCPSA